VRDRMVIAERDLDIFETDHAVFPARW